MSIAWTASIDNRSATAVLALTTSLIAIALSVIVFSTNPKRLTNQVFSAFLIAIAGSHLCVFFAAKEAISFYLGLGGNPIPYLRCNGGIAALFPWMLWVLKESLIIEGLEKAPILKRSLPWLILSLLFAPLCLLESYIPSISSPLHRLRGPTYLFGTIALGAVTIFLAFQAWFQTRTQKGAKRLELQFFVLNLSITSILSASFAISGNILDLPWLKQGSLISFLLGCGICAWAITYHRVFNIRQVCLMLVHLFGLLTIIALCTLYLRSVFSFFLPDHLALIFSVVVVTTFGFWANRRSHEWLERRMQEDFIRIRSSVIEMALGEPDVDKLIRRYELLLKSTWEAEFAALFLYRRVRSI